MAYKDYAPMPVKFLLSDDSITDKLPIQVELTTVEWDNVEDKPAEFPPESHAHGWDEITDKPVIEYQADSEAVQLSELVSDFNDLLSRLRTAGYMAPAPSGGEE